MNRIPKPIFQKRARYLPFLEQLETLFQEMDTVYTTVADRYGFHCNGCVDNCCHTRFHHHTFLELLYIKEGLGEFHQEQLVSAEERALVVYQKTATADRLGEGIRILCPLNQDERCIAYHHRPMICRLHGIPNEIHRPDGQIFKNPGCDAFFDQCRSKGKTDYIPFDRTPFYRKMAMLEKELRQELKVADKIKLTIAQMMVIFTGKNDEIN